MASTDKPIVLISGITGYLATWIAKLYLENGYIVRGTTRSAKKGEPFFEVFPQYRDSIQISEVPDISAPHAFREAIKGVSVFCHVATAVPTVWTKPTREYAQEIIDAAIACTNAALEAAIEEPGLKSFIMTSSAAANIDFGAGGANGKTWDENTWNQITLEEALTGPNAMSAYSYGKTASEKAVWDYYKTKKAHFSITTILPSYTYGEHIGIPGTKEEPVVGTNLLIKPLLTDPNADLTVMLGGVNNVRACDVALAHWLASKPEADGKRIVLAMPENKPLSAYVKFFQKRYPNLKSITKIPEGFVEPVDYVVDGSTFETVLGGKYSTFEETAADGGDYIVKVMGLQ